MATEKPSTVLARRRAAAQGSNSVPRTIYSLGSIGFAALSAIAALVASLFQAGYLFSSSHPLVVATSPPGAALYVDGRESAKAPTTLSLPRGVHTIEARLDGYESVQHAVSVSGREAGVVNIQLLPLKAPPNASAAVVATPLIEGLSNRITKIDAELEKLRTVAQANPAEVDRIAKLSAELDKLRGAVLGNP